MLLRSLWVVMSLLAGASALAEPKPTVAKPVPPGGYQLDAKLAEALRKAKWTDAKLVADSSTLRVITATHNNQPRIVLATTSNRLIDAGVRPPGTFAATANPSTIGSGLNELALTSSVTDSDGGGSESTVVLVVRDSGEIACRIEGSSRRTLGRGCGSSGWSTVTLVRQPEGFRATTEHNGVWSEPDGKGGCRARSPIRSTHNLDYTLSDRGTCAAITKP